MKLNIRKFMPMLHLCISIPFVHVEASLMREDFIGNTITYIKLNISIYKWEYNFRLYDTDERIFRRSK